MINKQLLCFLALALLLFSCSPVKTVETAMATSAPTATIAPTRTFVITPTLSPTVTATIDPASGFLVSSPLADIKLSELASIMSEPFNRPAPGLDDGHHGTDFSYYSHGSHGSILGLPIYSLLNGIVVGTTGDKDPYGYMVMIETPISAIPGDLLDMLTPPSSLSPYPYNPRMIFCPELKNQNWSETVGSLYILYAHMKEPAIVQSGDQVKSGQQLGFVGNTGLSGNPHLHLEMRWGPAGTKFASMAYYDTSASEAEMQTYCGWRISGRFVLQDPMEFINKWLDYTR